MSDGFFSCSPESLRRFCKANDPEFCGSHFHLTNNIQEGTIF